MHVLDIGISVWLDSSNSEYKNWKNKSDENMKDMCAIVKRTAKHDSKWFRLDCKEESEVVCKRRKNSPSTTERAITKSTIFSTTTSEVTFAPSTEQPTLPTTPSTSTIRPLHCKSGWKQFGKKCYQVTDKYRKTEENQEICEKWNSNLSSVHSDAENVFIASLYDKNKHIQPDSLIYFQLGAGSSEVPHFYWIDNSEWNYHKWMPGYPALDENSKSLRILVDPKGLDDTTFWINTRLEGYFDVAFGVCSYYL